MENRYAILVEMLDEIEPSLDSSNDPTLPYKPLGSLKRSPFLTPSTVPMVVMASLYMLCYMRAPSVQSCCGVLQFIKCERVTLFRYGSPWWKWELEDYFHVGPAPF